MPLLDEVRGEVEEVKADGAYDQKKVYEWVSGRQAKATIPPRRNAKIWKHGDRRGPRGPRDENLRRLRKRGRKRWKREVGYHERSLVETGMFRFKTILGNKLRSRNFTNQHTEARIGCKIINRMTQLHTVGSKD